MKSLATLALLAVAASAARLSGLSVHSESTDIIVELPAAITTFGNLDALSPSERRTLVGGSLMQATQVSQQSVVELLKSMGVEFEQFWITNTILVKNANKEVIAALLNHKDVEEIRPDREIAKIDMPRVHNAYYEPSMAKGRNSDVLWPLKQINAESAWAVSKGEGIVIANIDGGVRFSHEALASTYRGYDSITGDFDHDYNWWDKSQAQPVPTDDSGHGSHTMGNAAGNEASGFGVAPGSQWIAARGCIWILCLESYITSSAQFVLCPTKRDGTLPDCSKGANVVFNSWGGGQGSDWFSSYVDAWRAAGIIPVFAAGNSGPSCATINSPSDMETVISVGSTDQSGALSSFSSRGPGINSGIFPPQKPDISAPGESVVSVGYSSDTGLAVMSGTSMATPHVAGVVALIMSSFRNAKGRLPTYEEVFNILITSSQTNLTTPSGSETTCSNVRFDAVPNYFYGWGIVDAAKAVFAAST